MSVASSGRGAAPASQLKERYLQSLRKVLLNPIALLIRGSIMLLAWGVVYVSVVVLITSWYGTKWTWIIWGVSMVVVSAYGLWITRRYPGHVSMILGAYTSLSFLGAPTAMAAWNVNRGHRRHPTRSIWVRFGHGMLGLFLGLPVGIVLAVIPDAVQFFGGMS